RQPRGGQTYYVAEVKSPTSFTFESFPGGGPVTNVAVNDTFVFTSVSGAAPVSVLSDGTNGLSNFYLHNPQEGQWFRITVNQKEPGYRPDPLSSDDVHQYAGVDNSLTQYVQLDPANKKHLFGFEKNGLIEGHVFNDWTNTKTRQLADPGVAGVTVYL